MNSNSSLTSVGLAQIYAQFFIEDFATNVMRHLDGTYPVPNEQLKAFIEDKVASLIGSTPITLTNSNTISRFIFECADYALTHNVVDPTSRATWDNITQLPSIHHNELAVMVYSSAALYRKDIESTLLGVIARDATMATKAIVQAAQTRTAITDTGGSLHVFSWGILSDGLWLNGALMRAYDIAKVFRPGDPVIGYYAPAAFNFANQLSTTLLLEDVERTNAITELDSLISQANQTPTFAELLEDFSISELQGILFNSTVLSNYVAAWERGSTGMSQLIWSVQNLSTLARILMILREGTSEPSSDLVFDRLDQANDVVILCLAAFEALRETKFSDSLILEVKGEGEDPKVDVIVNADVLNSYHAMNGDDADLIRFGLYLDPRKGIPSPGAGWSLTHILARKDDVIPQIIAADADRLERLRNNDAAVIQEQAANIIGAVVDSYVQATNSDGLPPVMTQRINGLIRRITDSSIEMDLDREIVLLLTAVIDDPKLTAMAVNLMGYLSSEDDFSKTNASALTIASAAADDAFSYITQESI